MIRLSITAADFETRFSALLAQARETTQTVDRAVADILADVRLRGDAAVVDYTSRFDRVTLTPPAWPPRSIWRPLASRRSTTPSCRRTCG